MKLVSVPQLSFAEFCKLTKFDPAANPAIGPTNIVVNVEMVCYAGMKKEQAGTRNEHLQAVLVSVPSTSISIGSTSTESWHRATAKTPSGETFSVLVAKPKICIPGDRDTYLRIPYAHIDPRANEVAKMFPNASEALIASLLKA